jgi:transcriptional regulator with XRE-family HTH domain
MGSMEFASRLIQERARLGCTQAQLGRMLAAESAKLGKPIEPIRKTTISPWERGHRLPDPWYAYCLCSLLRKTPEALALKEVLTPFVVQEIQEFTTRQRSIQSVSTTGRILPSYVDSRVAPLTGDDMVDGLDWERLWTTLVATLHVDARVVEDQWIQTQNLLSRPRRQPGLMQLGRFADHIVRLRQLRGLTNDHALRHELGLMIGQCVIWSGHLFMGRDDYGSARAALRYAADLASEMGEDSLHATALISQGQAFGAPIPGEPPVWHRGLIRFLNADNVIRSSWTPEARAWLHASRAVLHVVAQNHVAAAQDIEAARRADGQIDHGVEPYFVDSEVHYLDIAEAKVAAHDHPDEAAQLLAARSQASGSLAMGAWCALLQAGIYSEAKQPELASDHAVEAMRMARAVGSRLLIHGVARIARRTIADYGNLPVVRKMEEELYDVDQPID